MPSYKTLYSQLLVQLTFTHQLVRVAATVQAIQASVVQYKAGQASQVLQLVTPQEQGCRCGVVTMPVLQLH
jgi:hypothetical protein